MSEFLQVLGFEGEAVHDSVVTAGELNMKAMSLRSARHESQIEFLWACSGFWLIFWGVLFLFFEVFGAWMPKSGICFKSSSSAHPLFIEPSSVACVLCIG